MSHDHVHFEPASLVAARMCTGCGSYVSSLHLDAHQKFHDRLATALNQEDAEETQAELF